MNKFKSRFRLKKPILKQLTVVCCFSFLIGILFNFLTILAKFKANLFDWNWHGMLDLGSAILLDFGLTFLGSLLLSFYWPAFQVFALILLLCSTISFYIQSKFGIIFDDVMLVNALDSVGHVFDVCDWWLLIYLLILWILPTAAIFLIKTIKSSLKQRLTAILAALLLSGAILACGGKTKTEFAFENFSPINYLGSFERYLSRFHHNRKIARNRISLAQNHHFSTANLPQNLKIILVLGESLRADHLQLNGYLRPTTPNLSKIKGLINFQVQARFNITSPALTALLSNRDFKDFVAIPPEKSLVDLFRKIGFHTSWFSAQSSKEFGNGMLNIMAMEADEYFFRDHLKIEATSGEKIYDQALLPFLKKELEEKRPSLIILHSFGSHIRYTDRYPKEFVKFQPECSKSPASCERQSLINSYDNSVLYTDFFLNEVVKSIKNKVAVMFYVSDHGNSLGENNQFANGGNEKSEPNKENTNIHVVPMIIYPSSKLLLISNYQAKFAQAKANSQKHSSTFSTNKINQNLFEQQVFFDSVLDCVGIKSDLLEKRNLSLCKK